MKANTPRVLLLVAQPFFQWRGSPIRVAYNVSALAESGYQVDLLTLPVGEPVSIPGVNIMRTSNPLRIRDLPIGPSFAKMVFDLLIALRARSLIGKHRYVAVHGVEECGLIAALLARRGGARAVYEKHSDAFSHRGNPARNLTLRCYSALERHAVRHIDMMIGTGPGLVEQARKMGCRAPCRHIPDIPSSRMEADPEEVARVREDLAPENHVVLAGYAGSFAAYQGMDLLFKAIPEAFRKQPQLRFVIVGGSPGQIAARRAQLAAAGCDNAAVFTGPVPPDKLPAFLKACDILLSPRLSGANTPLKLLDYLKAGRAVVATALPANRQILDEHNAVFVEPVPAALAEGILKLANDPALRKQLGAAGRERIRKEYNYDAFKKGLADAYEVMLRPTRKES